MKKIYPKSSVELNPFIAKHYDGIMNFITFGAYKRFIYRAIKNIGVSENDSILDMGCGTGRNSMLMSEYLSENGHITGVDISQVMEAQFKSKFQNDNRMEFINSRIDVPLSVDKKFDKVLISFVIHGFPHEVRTAAIKNAYDHLKVGGVLNIIDYAEFSLNDMPFHHRKIFETVECPYAFDFIEKDWKAILSDHGFSNFNETFYLKKYVRLLKAVKSRVELKS